MPSALEIDREAASPFLRVGLQWRVKNVDACIVHKDIEPPELGQRRGHGCLGRRWIGDVAGHEDCARILARQARGDRLTVCRVSLSDDNARALTHKRPRNRFADPAASAGDECNLAVEAPGHHQSTIVPSSRTAFPSMQHLGGERMASAGGLVDLDAKSGAFGDLPETVHHTDRAAHDLGIPRHGANHFLLDHMVRG